MPTAYSTKHRAQTPHKVKLKLKLKPPPTTSVKTIKHAIWEMYAIRLQPRVYVRLIMRQHALTKIPHAQKAPTTKHLRVILSHNAACLQHFASHNTTAATRPNTDATPKRTCVYHAQTTQHATQPQENANHTTDAHVQAIARATPPHATYSTTAAKKIVHNTATVAIQHF